MGDGQHEMGMEIYNGGCQSVVDHDSRTLTKTKIEKERRRDREIRERSQRPRKG